MAALFLKLFNMSMAASWMILAVIVLRLLLKRAPKWIRCVLWALVAVRLLCPISIESTLSLIPSSETLSPEAVQYASHPAIHSGVTVLDNAVNPVLGEAFAASPEASVNPLYVWAEIAGIVWATGAAILLAYAAISYFRLRRAVCESAPLWDNIYLCDRIPTPFILGIFRPHVYLPSGLSNEQMQSVMSHERAHLVRRDHWWKPLGWMLLTVYWFNPLCWAAYILLCRDIELACDEKVIRDMDSEGKKAYSQVLLSCSIPRRPISACPLAFGEVGVKARIKGVLNYRKPAFWVIAVAVVACIAAAVCFLTNPKEKRNAGAADIPSELSEVEWNAILSEAEPYFPQNTAAAVPSVVSADSMGEILCDRMLPSGIRVVCYCEPGSEYVKYWAVRNGDSLTRFCQEESGYREGYDVEAFSDVLGQSGFRILAPRGAAYYAYDYYVIEESGVPQLLAECANQVEEVDINRDGETDLRWCYHGDQEVYYYFRQDRQLYTSGGVPAIITQAASLLTVNITAENLFASMPSTFHFLSGAGGWQTELYWHGDGTFSGIFEDADAESKERCEFTGAVSAPRKISNLVYSADVIKLNYDEPGVTTTENGIKVTTAEPYGLDNADEIRIYLPGYPVSKLPEEAVMWLRGGAEEFTDGNAPQYLACFVLYNLNGQQAFFSGNWSAFSQ